MVWTGAVILIVLLWLRQSVLVILALTVLLLYFTYNSGHPEYAIYDLWEGLNRDVLLIFPLFLLGSSVLASGDSVHRLVDLFLVLCKPLPGGMAAASAISTTLVAALCGSPVIALFVVGPLLYPAMLEYGCRRSFSIGLLCASASIGGLLPPAIALVIYGAVAEVPVDDLYRLSAIVSVALLAALAFISVAIHWRFPREGWRSIELRRMFLRALPALCLVAVLLGGMYSRLLAPLQAATLFLFGALLVECVVYRLLGARLIGMRELGNSAVEVCLQLGRVLPLVAFSISLSAFFHFQQMPEQLAIAVAGQDLTRNEFLVAINVALLFVGTVMDMTTALVLFTPAIETLPPAISVEPVAFGVMTVANLGLSYLTPPSGAVLIAAMCVFRENFLPVFKAVAPFLIGLILLLFVAATQLVPD